MSKNVRARALSSSQENILLSPRDLFLQSNLPPAFANILKILGAVQIFELSQLSNRMCTLIQAANITFDHIVITFSESSGTIEFRNNREEPQLIFDFKTEKPGALKRTLKFGRLEIPASFADHTKISCYDANFESCVPACRQYFSNIFICRRELISFQLYYVSGPPKLRALFEHNYFNNHLVVKLYGQLIGFVGNVFQLLTEDRDLDGIVIDRMNKFDLREIFTLPHVCFIKTDWITRDTIMDVNLTRNLTRLTLISTKLTALDVNMLIKHWQNENWHYLQTIEICANQNLDSNHLKMGLHVLPRDPTRGDRCYIMDHYKNPYLLKLDKGYDVERIGRRATILHSNHKFLFAVWTFHQNGDIPDYPRQSEHTFDEHLF